MVDLKNKIFAVYNSPENVYNHDLLKHTDFLQLGILYLSPLNITFSLFVCFKFRP